MKKLTFVLSLLLFNYGTYASQNCVVHTWHDITAEQGEWQLSMRYISEQGEFMNRDCLPQYDAIVDPNQSHRYGTVVTDDNTFDIAYTVTLVKQTENQFVSPACVFIVSAKGPAIPDVVIQSYNGAKCRINNDPSINYFVS